MTDYAKENEVKAGTVLIADSNFICIEDGAELVVKEDRGGGLYVHCSGSDGRHYLDGQLGDGDAYVGFRLKPSA